MPYSTGSVGGGSAPSPTGPANTNADVVETYTSTTYTAGTWYNLNRDSSCKNIYKCVLTTTTKFTDLYEVKGGYGLSDGTLVLAVPSV
jgi:hypothetical protein